MCLGLMYSGENRGGEGGAGILAISGDLEPPILEFSRSEQTMVAPRGGSPPHSHKHSYVPGRK